MKKSIVCLILSSLLCLSLSLNNGFSLNPKTKSLKAPYIAIDISNPSKISFKVIFKDKINIEGQYNPQSEYLEAKATLQDINLTAFSKDLGFLKGGYIKKGDLRLTAEESYLLEGNLELANFILFKNIAFKLEGKSGDFSSSNIDLKAKGDFLTASAKAKYNQKVLKIDDLIIEGNNSKISSSANINTSSDSIKIDGQGYFDLADLFDILDAFDFKLTPLTKSNTQGLCNIKFITTGKLSPKTWETKLITNSDKLKIYKIESKNVRISLLKKENKLTISPLFADIAGGRLELRAILDLVTKQGSLNLITNDIDIAQIVKELKLKEQDYSGKLSLEAYLKNLDIIKWEKLDGQGKVWIKDGNIWEIDFLEGMGEFLFIPEFKKIRFSEGYSNLFFKERDIIFDDIELTSAAMTLAGGGKISLDGELNFILFPQFDKKFVDSSEGFKKHITNFLGEKGLVLEIKGKVKDPQYNMKPAFLSPLKRIEGFFKNLFGE